MHTTIEVVVEELCNNTVARKPIIRSATGLLRILLDAKASPAVFPPSNRQPQLNKSMEQMKKYKNPRSSATLPDNKATHFAFPKPSSSENAQKSGSYLVQTKLKHENLNHWIKKAANCKTYCNLTGPLGTKIVDFR